MLKDIKNGSTMKMRKPNFNPIYNSQYLGNQGKKKQIGRPSKEEKNKTIMTEGVQLKNLSLHNEVEKKK